MGFMVIGGINDYFEPLIDTFVNGDLIFIEFL